MKSEDRRPDLFGRIVFVAMLVGLLGAGGVARADSAVILGAGQIGRWITTGALVNPNSSGTEVMVAPHPISSSGGAVPCAFPEVCPFYDISLPALGSNGLPFAFTGSEFGTVYVTQTTPIPAGQAFPILQATIYENDFCRSVETFFNLRRSMNIPIILLSKLIAANLSTLNFPGPELFPESIGAGTYSNLVLGNIERGDGTPGEDLPLRLELFDPLGNLVGSTSLVLSYGETLVIGNPVTYLGLPGFFYGGLLRVKRLSGGALMWGIVYTVDDERGISASTGVNLSP